MVEAASKVTHTQWKKTNHQDDAILLVRALVRRRHESVNKQFKQFKCIALTFCHDIGFHGQCFRAVVVLTQLALCHGKPLWTVHAYGDP